MSQSKTRHSHPRPQSLLKDRLQNPLRDSRYVRGYPRSLSSMFISAQACIRACGVSCHLSLRKILPTGGQMALDQTIKSRSRKELERFTYLGVDFRQLVKLFWRVVLVRVYSSTDENDRVGRIFGLLSMLLVSCQSCRGMTPRQALATTSLSLAIRKSASGRFFRCDVGGGSSAVVGSAGRMWDRPSSARIPPHLPAVTTRTLFYGPRRTQIRYANHMVYRDIELLSELMWSAGIATVTGSLKQGLMCEGQLYDGGVFVRRSSR
ncbi:hypothetical protein KC325_g317 [Hortaea werneckii]|nr:hypothetical protein KC325_g317 [Hortaea werneckii]